MRLLTREGAELIIVSFVDFLFFSTAAGGLGMSNKASQTAHDILSHKTHFAFYSFSFVPFTSSPPIKGNNLVCQNSDGNTKLYTPIILGRISQKVFPFKVMVKIHGGVPILV